ncbi:MAG: gamma carbonic anhydrase family protein [Caulobacterales bacterium]|jgi:carbonic anhydrase/acetyltransferase-like protein (isoleucine patch superfamily)
MSWPALEPWRIGGPVTGVERAAFVHPTACLYGLIDIAEEVSIWCNVVMRAEFKHIAIGRRTNVQDFTMIHVGNTTPTIIGANCSITHHVTLHGCTIGDDCLIGIGATIMDACVIGEGSIIAGGAFLKEGTIIPPHSIVIGAPAEVKRTRDMSVANRTNADLYFANAQGFARGDFRVWAKMTGEA